MVSTLGSKEAYSSPARSYQNDKERPHDVQLEALMQNYCKLCKTW